MSGKWLELLKEIAPPRRVGVIRDPTCACRVRWICGYADGGASGWRWMQPPIGVHDADEIERGRRDLARGSNGGLIVVGPIRPRLRIAI